MPLPNPEHKVKISQLFIFLPNDFKIAKQITGRRATQMDLRSLF